MKRQTLVKLCLLPLLGCALLGSSCAHIGPTPPHQQGADTSPIFAIVFSGTEASKWSLTAPSICWMDTNATTENMTFDMPKPYKHTMRTKAAGEPDTFQVQETVTRTSGSVSRFDPSTGPKCPSSPPPSMGSVIETSDPNCGTKHFVQNVQIVDNGDGSFTISTASPLGATNDSDDSDEQEKNDFKSCTNVMTSPFYSEKPLTVKFSADDLHDGKQIVLKEAGHDTTGTLVDKGETKSADVTWKLTMCRGVSNLAFEDAKNAAWDELKKSSSLNAVWQQNAGLTITNRVLDSGVLGFNNITGQSRPDIIYVDWKQMDTVFDLMGVLAHEVGHSADFDSKGYTHFLAAPFLKYLSQYQVLLYQEEFDASVFAVKVLDELKKADPEIAPCIDAYIDSNAYPPITDMAKGEVQAAKDWILRNYDVTYKNFQETKALFPGTLKPDPSVQAALTKVDFNQLASFWGVPIGE